MYFIECQTYGCLPAGQKFLAWASCKDLLVFKEEACFLEVKGVNLEKLREAEREVIKSCRDVTATHQSKVDGSLPVMDNKDLVERGASPQSKGTRSLRRN